MEIKRIVTIREGRAWRETYTTNDPVEVYKALVEDLIAKKINACAYIRSIKRENLYNGFQRITVSHENGVKAVYTVKA